MTGRSLDTVCALVKDELATIETYRLALERLGGRPEGADLRRIENDHEEAVSLLQERVARAGVEPPTSAGAWGFWMKLKEATASLGGERAAMRALRDGEERDIADYEQALSNTELDYELKELIGAHILPKTKSHLTLLDQYITDVKGSSYHDHSGTGPEGEGRDAL
jgi:hypothetical protein